MIYPEINLRITRSCIGPHDTVEYQLETSIEVNGKIIPFTETGTINADAPIYTFVTRYHNFNQDAKKIYLEKPAQEPITQTKSTKYSF